MLKIFFELLAKHGWIAVAALLLAIAAVAWVAPNSTGGVAFLLLLVFIVTFTLLRLIKRLVNAWRARGEEPAAEASEPAAGIDAPPATSDPVDNQPATSDATDEDTAARR